jgi:hypothetical protein
VLGVWRVRLEGWWVGEQADGCTTQVGLGIGMWSLRGWIWHVVYFGLCTVSLGGGINVTEAHWSGRPADCVSWKLPVDEL